ncbi:MAG: tape measure protein [Gammaproteobacteria bacterium]|nr:tape measure protein [Gammaproteobacteria bacterium]
MAELKTSITISARAAQALTELAKVANEFKSLGGDAAKSGAAIGSSFTRGALGVNSILPALTRLAGAFVGVGSKAGKAGEDINRGFSVARRGVESISNQLQQARRQFIGFFAAQAGLSGAITLGRSVFNVAAEFQQLGNSMRAVTGSSDVATRELAFVRAEAERLNLPLDVATRQFVQLSAAANGTTISGEGARKVFTALAEAGVVLGLNSEQLSGSFLALQQIISKGTVSAEELRGQLGERLPGAFQIAARAVGVTTAELGKLLATGSLSSDAFVLRFAAQLKKEFGAGVPAAVKSSQGALLDFQNSILDLKLAIANSGFLEGVTTALRSLATDLRDPKILANVRGIGESLGNLIKLAASHAKDIDRLLGLVAGFSVGGSVGDFAAKFAPNPLAKLLASLGGRAAGAAVGAIAADDLIQVSPEKASEVDNLREAIVRLRAGIQSLREQSAAGKIDPAHAAAAIAVQEAEITRIRQKLPQTRAGRPSIPDRLPEIDLETQPKRKGKTDEAKRLEAVQALIAKSREQAETLGFTARELALYELAQIKVTAADNKAITAAKAQINAAFKLIEADEARKLSKERQLEAEKMLFNGIEEETQAWQRLDEARQQDAESIRQQIDPFRTLNQELDRARDLVGKKGGITQAEFIQVAATIRERIQQVKDDLDSAGNAFGEFGVQAARNIQSTLSDFLFDPFTDGLAGMVDSLQQTLTRMAADIVAAQLGKKLFGDFDKSGKVGGFASTAFDFLQSVFKFHDGGIVGAGGTPLRIPALAFAGAPRFHSGGVLGLGPGDTPAVLKLGEEVLTRDDPRHALNGGGMTNVTVNIQTKDIESFRASRGQLEAELRRAVGRGVRNA